MGHRFLLHAAEIRGSCDVTGHATACRSTTLHHQMVHLFSQPASWYSRTGMATRTILRQRSHRSIGNMVADEAGAIHPGLTEGHQRRRTLGMAGRAWRGRDAVVRKGIGIPVSGAGMAATTNVGSHRHVRLQALATYALAANGRTHQAGNVIGIASASVTILTDAGGRDRRMGHGRRHPGSVIGGRGMANIARGCTHGKMNIGLG